MGIDVVVDNVAAKDVVRLNRETYVPNAWTPLYDAIGKTVTQLDKQEGKAKVLVILTDGHENCSREYTKDTIRSILAEKQAKDGWLVLFLGADIDSFDEGGKIGIAAASTINFSKMGMNKTMDVAYASTRRYGSAASSGQSPAPDEVTLL